MRSSSSDKDLYSYTAKMVLSVTLCLSVFVAIIPPQLNTHLCNDRYFSSETSSELN